MVAVGGVPGLYIQVLRTGGKTWILRTVIVPGSRPSDIGLGGYPEVSLAAAREAAREMRKKIRQGINPLEERRAARAALLASARRGLTFAEAVDRYHASKSEEFSSEKHRKQWRSPLDTYAMPHLGKMPVQDITVQDMLLVLQPIWSTKTETATRMRGRIEAVLTWATVAGHRSGDNPARWGGNLKELLPKPSKVAKSENWPALALADAPAWFAALRQREGMGSRALEFLTLTAARSGEVRGARWDEIDHERGIWTVRADRTKMSREHRVPLPPAAVALLDALPRFHDSPLVFPAARGGQLSDMTLSATMRRMHETEVAAGRRGWLDPRNGRPAVVHGQRALFRSWAAETGQDRDVSEMALGHLVGNDVERAYLRTDRMELRRGLLIEWAQFLGMPT